MKLGKFRSPGALQTSLGVTQSDACIAVELDDWERDVVRELHLYPSDFLLLWVVDEVLELRPEAWGGKRRTQARSTRS